MRKFLRATGLAAIGMLAMSASVSAQANVETLTVDDTVGGVGFSAAVRGGPATGTPVMTRCIARLEAEQIRYWTNGTAPTSSTGIVMEAGDSIVIEGTQRINAFRAIRTTADSGTLSVECSVSGTTEILPTGGGGGGGVAGAVEIAEGANTAQVTATSGGSLQVECTTGCSGGTQYAEDAIHASGNTGTLALVVRNDAGTALAADGDNIPLMVDSAGALYVSSHAVTATNLDVQIGGSDTVQVQSNNANLATESTLAGIDAVLDNIFAAMNADVVHDDPVGPAGPQVMCEAKDIDGGALPNTVAEGDAARATCVLNGASVVVLSNEAGTVDLGEAIDTVLDNIYAALNVDAAHDSPVVAAGPQVMCEAKDIDGGALPNEVAEGDAARIACALNGTGIVVLANEAGTVDVGAGLLTSAQLIDDVIFADDAAFTIGTSKVAAIGFTVDDTASDSADEGDVGIPRMTATRLAYAVPAAYSLNGATTLKYTSAGSTEDEHAVCTGPCNIYSITVTNTNAAARYIRCENDTAGNTTPGSETVELDLAIPGATAGAGFTTTFPVGAAFSTAATCWLVTGAADTDVAEVAANEIKVFYTFKQ